MGAACAPRRRARDRGRLGGRAAPRRPRARRHARGGDGAMTILAAELQVLPLAVFGLVLAITLAITFWASRRTSTASEFFAAGRGISGFQNGWAIAGDYMSASTFLGFAGLIFLFGVDAFVGLAAAIASFLVVLLFLAERMRNA